MTTLALPLPPRDLCLNARVPWYVRASLTRQYIADVTVAAMEQTGTAPPLAPTPCRAVLVFVVSASDRRDLQALGEGSKAAIDALRRWGLFPDDSPRHLPALDYRWRRAKQGEAAHIDLTLYAWKGEAP